MNQQLIFPIRLGNAGEKIACGEIMGRRRYPHV